MAYKQQVCKSCKTKFTKKTHIDKCPVCRGTKIKRSKD
jgi:predicted RNA-binding Zn-ribbon protein involved in translation (DUF1610 family)